MLQVEDFLGLGLWVRTTGLSWVEEALGWLTRQGGRTVYLREGHDALLQALPVLMQALPPPTKGTAGY